MKLALLVSTIGIPVDKCTNHSYCTGYLLLTYLRQGLGELLGFVIPKSMFNGRGVHVRYIDYVSPMFMILCFYHANKH